MKKASISDAKNNLSKLIDQVKAGSPIVIVDRGRPVARLEPVTGTANDETGRLDRLFRDGLVHPARRVVARGAFAATPPRTKGGASGVRALISERREGR